MGGLSPLVLTPPLPLNFLPLTWQQFTRRRVQPHRPSLATVPPAATVVTQSIVRPARQSIMTTRLTTVTWSLTSPRGIVVNESMSGPGPTALTYPLPIHQNKVMRKYHFRCQYKTNRHDYRNSLIDILRCGRVTSGQDTLEGHLPGVGGAFYLCCIPFIQLDNCKPTSLLTLLLRVKHIHNLWAIEMDQWTVLGFY